ncbi:MAG: hypothetical protein JSS02_07880 [Planctomycetes bacterium]|nr:hypothetical protein [Planctomycetota bacterium]
MPLTAPATRQCDLLGLLLQAAPLAFLGALLFSSPTQAGIVAINTPSTSLASITFDDTNSTVPPAGTTNTGPLVNPWNGSTVTLSLTTDPNTADFATGSIDASYIFASNTYALNLFGITLNQVNATFGFATLTFNFNVEFQLDAAGLPLQSTLFPNFVVNGTVMSSPGSFAAVKGFINYSGVTTAGTIGVVETVIYNSVWTTPGPFSGIANGTPTFGVTPALVGGTTLTLDGTISFLVDPASISAYSVPAAVPEPATSVLWGLGGLVLFAGSRLRRRS